MISLPMKPYYLDGLSNMIANSKRTASWYVFKTQNLNLGLKSEISKDA